MSVRHVRKALEVRTLTSPQKFVLVVLAEHAHDQTNEAWPSAQTIADETSLSVSAVRKALAALRDSQLVEIRHPANTVHSSTTYTLFPDVQVGLFLIQGDPSPGDRGTPVRRTGKPEGEPEVEPERNRSAFVNSAVVKTMEGAKARGLVVIAVQVRSVAGALFQGAPDTEPEHFANAYVSLRMQGKSPTALMVADNIAGHVGSQGGTMGNVNAKWDRPGAAFGKEGTT